MEFLVPSFIRSAKLFLFVGFELLLIILNVSKTVRIRKQNVERFIGVVALISSQHGSIVSFHFIRPRF